MAASGRRHRIGVFLQRGCSGLATVKRSAAAPVNDTAQCDKTGSTHAVTLRFPLQAVWAQPTIDQPQNAAVQRTAEWASNQVIPVIVRYPPAADELCLSKLKGKYSFL